MNIPPGVEVNDKARLFVWRPCGVLGEPQVDEIIAFVATQEKKFGKSFNRLTDMSGLDAVDLTFDYVFRIALFRRLSRMGQAEIRSAFLVTNSAVAHYVKVHAVVTDHSPLKVKIFKELESAAKWLGVSVEIVQANLTNSTRPH
jgi:hypothetical protein